MQLHAHGAILFDLGMITSIKSQIQAYINTFQEVRNELVILNFDKIKPQGIEFCDEDSFINTDDR